jgi:hypothetical protein
MAKLIQSIVDIEAQTLTIKTDGKQDLIIHAFELDATIKTHCVLHGAKQKIVDAAALPNGATITEKYEAMKEVHERITSVGGTWNKQGEGNSQPSGLLFKALCRLYPGKTTEALRTWLDKQDKTQQAALRKNPKIAAIIETIKAESAKDGGLNSDDLLASLDEI